MSTPKISVIVPVYNAEKYLHRCIESILAQTFTDFELLLIDDGSKDESGAICDEYAVKDSRVRVFHKENGGVSSARNVGLDNAKGEWITFVDSDDYIEKNFLKSFEGNLEADLVVGNAVLLTYKIVKRIELNCIPKGCYQEVKNTLSSHLIDLIFRVPWGKMYRTCLVSDLRFNEGMHLGEDTLFNLCYYRKMTSILVQDNGSLNSSYVYHDSENVIKKYEMSVKHSVDHLTALGNAYDSLNIRCKKFEGFMVCCFYECCAEDILVHAALWYENKIIRKFCLRRAACMGVFPWIKVWLLFHGFYRLKMYLINRNACL